MSAVLFAASFWHYFFGISLFTISLFLILLVLVQRGRGGGLTGALGGMGGQSAFGAKAGDTFTRVTMVTATLWILISVAAIKVLGTQDDWGASDAAAPTVITEPGSDTDATGTQADLPPVGQSPTDGSATPAGGLEAPEPASKAPEPPGGTAAPETPAAPADAP